MRKNKNIPEKPKRVEIGGAIVMALISAIIPLWKLIFIPISIVIFFIAILLMASAYSKDSLWKSFIMPAAIIVFCASSLFVYQICSKPIFATPDALISPTLQNMDIRISDLTRESVTVQNKTFTKCNFYGPAMIYGERVTILNGTAEAPDANSFYVETTNKSILGAVRFRDCIMDRCSFHRIGLIGSPEAVKSWKANINK
jgi:hypothetical protein